MLSICNYHALNSICNTQFHSLHSSIVMQCQFIT